MKKSKDFLSLAVGLMLSVVLIAGFMNPVFASEVDEDGGWSEDETAFAYVLGKYTQIGTYYDLRQHHYGEITTGDIFGEAHTRFEQSNYSDIIYDEDYPLDPYENESDTTFNDFVKFVYTCTYSGANKQAWRCTIDYEIGPPGAQ